MSDELDVDWMTVTWSELIQAIRKQNTVTKMRPCPKFELLQSVQLRGRYEPSAEIRRGLIIDRAYGHFGWSYSIQWIGESETVGMFESDIEPAKLLLPQNKAVSSEDTA